MKSGEKFLENEERKEAENKARRPQHRQQNGIENENVWIEGKIFGH